MVLLLKSALNIFYKQNKCSNLNQIIIFIIKIQGQPDKHILFIFLAVIAQLQTDLVKQILSKVEKQGHNILHKLSSLKEKKQTTSNILL